MKKRANPLFKEVFRSIWQTRTRFLSLLVIVALGCGFFAGLKSSCPDMKLTADRYFDDSQLMDLHLMSTFGLNEDDIEAIQSVEGIRGFSAGYSSDFVLKTEEQSETIVKVYSIGDNRDESDADYMNRPTLIEGRLPEKSGECVIETHFNSAFLHTPPIHIGDTVTLMSGSRDTEITDILEKSEYTVVGVVQLPLYIGFTRGHSTIGDGQVDAYAMIPEEDFALEVYTDAYITLDETTDLSAFSDEYETAVETASDRFKIVAARRGEERYQEIVTDAQAEIDDGRRELEDGEKERDEKLAEAEQELADAEWQIADGWQKYQDGLKTLNTETANAEKELSDGEQKLAEGENSYEEGMQQYQDGRKEYDAKLPEAEAQLEEYRKQLEELQAQAGEGIAQIDQARELIAGIEGILNTYVEKTVGSVQELTEDEQMLIQNADSLLQGQAAYPYGTSLTNTLTGYVTNEGRTKESRARVVRNLTKEISAGLDAQDQPLAEARAGIAQLTEGIASGEKELADGKARLDAAEKELAENRILLDEKSQELSEGWKELARQKNQGYADLEQARIDLVNAEKELKDGKAEYEKEKADSAAELEDARKELTDAERELADLKEPTWYVWDRGSNPEYASYEDNTDKIDAIAAVFPVFFILVAALVCLTTMTRMVEEQRTQIGTFKALGYSRGTIMAKYIGYAAVASIVGSLIGLAIGFKLFPMVIINAYRIMYEMPKPLTPIRPWLGLGCILVALLCMCLTTFAACTKQTAEVPSQLMRPKAPKNGKRVFLEKIDCIWKRLNFSQKVTVRNLFRYKQRVLMTVVGIAGCTALVLTGFGLRYAIMSIGDKQYDNVFVYDTAVSFDDELSDEKLKDYTERAVEIPEVMEAMPIMSRSLDVTGEKNRQSITLVVPNRPELFGNYIDLHERVSKESLDLADEGVIINEKLAKLLDVKAGEDITLVNPDGGRPVPVKVTGISENYAMNYVYMTPVRYEEIFREDPTYSTLFLNYREGTDEDTLSSELMNLGDDVLAVIQTSGISDKFSDTLKSLNYIVWVIIVSAGLLAFVVLYNLANINVNERVRELATIKVLGFYDKEVTRYITRENNISCIIGLAIGLVLGIWLEKFVILTAEVDVVMFAPDIAWYCFVLAAAVTMLFNAIVNWVLHFHLKKIDMVESLKSVE